MTITDTYLTVIGERIRTALAWKNMTQTELIKRSGITNGTLWHVMTNKYRDPRLYTLTSIADVLEVSLDWLVGRSDRP